MLLSTQKGRRNSAILVAVLISVVAVLAVWQRIEGTSRVTGQSEPTREFSSNTVDAYGDFLPAPSSAITHVEQMYLSRDPNVDFVGISEKLMTYREYAENINTRLTGGVPIETAMPESPIGYADPIVVVGFKTHARVERLGLHQLSLDDDTPSSPNGFLSPVDGMMGVVHALDAYTLEPRNEVLYQSGTAPDIVVALQTFVPQPIPSRTPVP